MVAPLKVPGQQAKLGTVPTGPANQTELPEIYEAQPGDAMPSICLIGDSGAGKTHQLGLLIAHLRTKGLATIVLSVEDKHQGLQHLSPLILPIGAPVKTAVSAAYPLGMRQPSATEKYNRLLEFRDRLRGGHYRTHGTLRVGAIVTDGLTEIGDVYKTHKLATAAPVAGGGADTRRAWGDMGEGLLDYMAALKQAASDSGKTYGVEPLAVVATVVEVLKDGKFIPLLPGNIAPDNFARQFEVILRLAVESSGPNTTTMQHVMHTMGGETFLPQTGRWIAKAPTGFEPKIVNPNLGEIFDRLISNYKGGTAIKGE